MSTLIYYINASLLQMPVGNCCAVNTLYFMLRSLQITWKYSLDKMQ